MNKSLNSPKKVLLTFDYEVYFRESGSFQQCIQKPVDELAKLMKEHRIVATFFVDILYYLRMLEREETRSDAESMKRQLQRLVRAGNRIEPHLHPHWLDAEFKDGAWSFPHYERYRLQALGQEQIMSLFRQGCRELEQIAKEVRPDYRVMAYRAGGWCIQPFDKLKKAFAECHILVDSSVAPRMRGMSDVHYFDFTGVPDRSHYSFDSDPTQWNRKGHLTEIPISTYRRTSLFKIKRKIVNRFYRDELLPYGDGSGIPLKEDFRKKWLSTYEMITLERMFPKDLIEIVGKTPQDAVNIISHPKGMSRMSMRCIQELASQDHHFLTLEQYYKREIAAESR
ncbi:hypothetical protein [Cohnella zeiphila]|uniref:NodB homology domain-containing protein n=1 Tax=Cohnella zeiphila TaxID=2761120 RepID=A0A7X0SN47_9BACL|nr:hypothetical protein [Cohnella zeiphila]MBB6733055.1 hypothetical protein [Cohnella zeiphila]